MAYSSLLLLMADVLLLLPVQSAIEALSSCCSADSCGRSLVACLATLESTPASYPGGSGYEVTGAYSVKRTMSRLLPRMRPIAVVATSLGPGAGGATSAALLSSLPR